MKTGLFQATLLVLMIFPITLYSQDMDWGDAPDPSYPTLAANNGAVHMIVPGFVMGVSIDGESNGIPSGNAHGDDQSGADDADGVVFTSWIVANLQSAVTVSVSMPGLLNAWIDYNTDGDWADAGEQIFADAALSAGANYLTFNVPAGIASGSISFTRFRYSTAAGLSYTGLAPDGEVEDYQLLLGLPATGDTYLDPNPCMTLTQNEISMDLIPDPQFGPPSLIVAAYNDEPFPGGPGLGVSYSTDAGASWSNTQLPYPSNPITGANFLDAFDPSVCIDDSGHVFVAHIATDNNWGVGPVSGLYVHKSTDGGVTWPSYTQVSADAAPVTNPDTAYRFNDRDQIVADNYTSSPYYGNIYLTWIKDRGWNMAQPMSDIYFSYSSDGGNTFSTAKRINSWVNSMGNMPVADVGKDGTVYVVWVDYNVQTGGQGILFIDISTDGGVSWGPDHAIMTYDLPPINLNGGADVRAKGAAVIRVMPSNPNELYIVYAADPDQTGPDEGDIFLIKSTDGGNTWSSPARVNDDATSNDQVMPWMDIKANGIIDIAWYDRRNDGADLQWDVYFTSSTDGGNSFATNTQINATSFFSPNPWKVADDWMGEYPALVTDNSNAFIAYTTSVPDVNGDVVFSKISNPDLEQDWGDAPDPSYPTLSINDGARHTINGSTYLGSLCDAEPDALPNDTATGDNLHNQNDEDGIVFPAVMRKGDTENLQITASTSGVLNAWFDFNADGDWTDPGEHIIVDQALVAGLNNIGITIPSNATADTTFSRFRFATYGGLSPTGSASDGEVEDYRVILLDAVPQTLYVNGVSLGSGQSECYNAIDTIFVASGSAVTVNSGAQADFVSGEIILFKPGFHAHSGSTVHAWITLSEDYCGGQSTALINTEQSRIEKQAFRSYERADGRVRLLSTETKPEIAIELYGDMVLTAIEIKDTWGKEVFHEQYKSIAGAAIDLEYLAPGVYVLNCLSPGEATNTKIIKF